MEKAFKKVEKTLDRLHDLQEIHLESFGQKILPDLEKQSAERTIEVDKLMKEINNFMTITKNKTDVGTDAMKLCLNDRIKNILEQNQALEIRVQDFKADIKKEMKQVSKGKQVIGSYRSSSVVSNHPKVISITN